MQPRSIGNRNFFKVVEFISRWPCGTGLNNLQITMKTTTVSLIVACACVTGLQGEERNPGSDRAMNRHDERHQAFSKTWKQADQNGDGVITREEFDQMPRLQKLPNDQRERLFKRLDKNQDGQMGKDEIRRILEKPRHRDGLMTRIWELDTDKSGGISFEEFQQGRMVQKIDLEKQKAIFGRLDEDGDGVVTPKDKPKRPRDRPEGKRDQHRMPPHVMLRRLDANRDGSVSLEEFQQDPAIQQLAPQVQQRRYDRADKNGDGKLSEEDFSRRMKGDGRPGASTQNSGSNPE